MKQIPHVVAYTQIRFPPSSFISPGPSAPQDVKAFSKVVVWGKPSSNDTVSGYEVVIGNQQLSLDGDSRFYEFSQCLSSGMLIKVRLIFAEHKRGRDNYYDSATLTDICI